MDCLALKRFQDKWHGWWSRTTQLFSLELTRSWTGSLICGLHEIILFTRTLTFHRVEMLLLNCHFCHVDDSFILSHLPPTCLLHSTVPRQSPCTAKAKISPINIAPLGQYNRGIALDIQISSQDRRNIFRARLGLWNVTSILEITSFYKMTTTHDPIKVYVCLQVSFWEATMNNQRKVRHNVASSCHL